VLPFGFSRSQSHSATSLRQDDVERLGPSGPRLLRDRHRPNISASDGSRPGPTPNIASSPRHVIELHDAIRNHQRMMIWQRDDAGTEPNPLRTLGNSPRNHQLGRGDDFVARPSDAPPIHASSKTDAIKMLDQINIASNRKRWVFIDWVKWREKNSSSQAVWVE